MNIAYSNQARHFLHQHREISRHILIRIEELAQKPYDKAMQVRGTRGLYRIRLGDIRILYEIDEKEQSLGIIRIARRENAYD